MSDPAVVDTQWLADHLLDEDVGVIDVRPPHFFTQAHLPGAVNVPTFLLDRVGGPDGGQLASHLGRAGIRRSTHVVAYDDGASPAAAYLFWLLQFYGHPSVSVLDGGITRWRHEGRDWEYTPSNPIPAIYELSEPDPDVLADLEAVRASLDRDDVVIVDTRTPAEFLGLQATARRNGHVPGSVNIDWTNNLIDDDGVARLRSDEELRQLYESAGVTPDKRVIVHCQSGNRSSETYLILKKLGYPRVANYIAGWQEWGNRDDVPVDE